MARFKNDVTFQSLSVRDLLEARDMYHYHLTNLDNVVGTAVGRYRFHPRDVAGLCGEDRGIGSFDGRKSLLGSVAWRTSHPAVLVLVKQWLKRKELGDRPEQYVPPFLYLPDGRVVPTCVLEVDRNEGAAAPRARPRFSKRLLGGGFPCLVQRQGETQLGTVGCLVTDGHRVYALTNAHVSGRGGDLIATMVKDDLVPIGSSSGRSLAKVPFEEVYPGWPGRRALSNVDAGLVELGDKTGWTAQIYGIGTMGEPLDLNVDTINLNLIGCPVTAHGGASGKMSGEILALFYRYRSLGGYDYIADFLIGPPSPRVEVLDNGELRVAPPAPAGTELRSRPGDSGTIWFYHRDADYLAEERQRLSAAPEAAQAPAMPPLAIQWGGQQFFNNELGEVATFVLASNLATTLRQLEVEAVRDWNIGLPEYWGKLGHFAMAQKAVELLETPNLKTLMTAQLGRITYPVAELTEASIPAMAGADFVPMADVPDLVWKAYSGARNRKQEGESGNHYVDLDHTGTGEFAGRDLTMVWDGDPANLDPQLWARFYASLDDPGEEHKWGALPFRVWQIFDEMLRVLSERRAGYLVDFVAMAGVLSHYVTDACMPLHNTRLHHGYPGADEAQQKVHAYLDANIISLHKGQLLRSALETAQEWAGQYAFPTPGNGREAANETMELMTCAYEWLAPERILDAFNESIGWQWQSRYSHIVDAIGADLELCIAEGVFRLAAIWEAAWNGAGMPGRRLPHLPDDMEHQLSSRCLDHGFLRCHLLGSLSVDAQGHLTSA